MVLENKTLLIVGGTGVISFAVVKEALKQGFSVTCINRGKSKNQKLDERVEVIHADYRNEKLIRDKLKNRHFDTVVDVLCYSKKDIEYSVGLFKDLCEQYVFFSSCAVYNKGKGDYECTEDSELINPVWDYSISKVACEKKLIELATKENINYTIVRPAVTYGDTRIPYGVMPPYGYHGTLIHRILNGKPIITWDGGMAISTITHVEDFAVGLVGLLGNPKAYNQAFHIVGDERYRWKDVLTTIGEILNKEVHTFDISKEVYAKEVPSKAGEILGGRGVNQLLNNSKIKSVVPNFKTTISLKEGLTRTIRYYQANNYLRGIDWRFEADTDRIISKWIKKKHLNKDNFNTDFVDYLGNSSRRDRWDYYIELHKDNVLAKMFLKLESVIQRINNRLK